MLNDGGLSEGFADVVIAWFKTHGRRDLPWQADPSPYRVWVSEIMLQQTRVSTVIPYFQRFMVRFPEVASLAAADVDVVLHLWTGLGYYARARNLHQAARTIVAEHGGGLPETVAELEQLSGIGRSTAGAIVALAHGHPAPILDGNVKRVLARCFAVAGYPGNSKTQSELWAIAEQLLPQKIQDTHPHPSPQPWDTHPKSWDTHPVPPAWDTHSVEAENRIAAYTQGMMDLGATLCTRTNPDCPQCPLQRRCLAHQRGEVERYPGKKSAKILPIRSATMLILQDGEGRVLLEKRPPHGIWGSLYSLPQIDSSHGTPINGTPTDETPTNGTPMPRKRGTTTRNGTPMLPAELSGLRLADKQPVELAPIRHSFTHFKLDIRPILYRVTQASAVADSDRWLWYSIAHPAEVGLAAPVGKLLAALAATESHRPAL